MIPNSLEAITAGDIQQLVAESVEEGVTLEFKRDLPGGDSDSKKEFIADVCALANTKGGDLVFGVAEGAEGQAEGIVPLSFNADEVVTRLTNVLTDCLEPRLHGVRMQPVKIGEGCVLVIRVPRSFAGIHRSKRDAHFWVRESRSKRQLDVPGITSRISELLGREDRVADFFARRYAAVSGGGYPLDLRSGPKLVIHILPSRDILSGEEVDLTPFLEAATFVIAGGGRSSCASPTFEGVLHHAPVRSEGIRGGTLLFRSGVVESVSLVNHWENPQGFKRFDFESIEKLCVDFLDGALALGVGRLAGGWPVSVRIALIGAHEYIGEPFSRDVQRDMDWLSPIRVHSPALIFPDILLSQRPASVPLLLQLVFDRLWQSWGYPRSFSYQPRGDGFFWQECRIS